MKSLYGSTATSAVMSLSHLRLIVVSLPWSGWGYADFTNGKPGNEALHKTCFPCHELAKARECVFTRYAR